MNTVTYEDTEKFIPPVTSGKVIKVYDGDTITIASTLPWSQSPIYRFSVRLRDIDCLEINSDAPNAITARDTVHELVFGRVVTLDRVDLDKYGRILADVYCDGVNLSQLLLEQGLAVPY